MLATFPVYSDGDFRVVKCLTHAGKPIKLVFTEHVWSAIAAQLVPVRPCGRRPRGRPEAAHVPGRLLEISRAAVAAGPFKGKGLVHFLSAYALSEEDEKQVRATVRSLRQAQAYRSMMDRVRRSAS